jgi:hypothetical protein
MNAVHLNHQEDRTIVAWDLLTMLCTLKVSSSAGRRWAQTAPEASELGGWELETRSTQRGRQYSG